MWLKCQLPINNNNNNPTSLHPAYVLYVLLSACNKVQYVDKMMRAL